MSSTARSVIEAKYISHSSIRVIMVAVTTVAVAAAVVAAEEFRSE